MVLGAPEGNHLFVVLVAALRDELGHGRGADKGEGAHRGVVAQRLHNILSSLDHLEDASGDARLFEQRRHPSHRMRHLFRRLENDTVAHCEGDRDCPHGDHDGEVEGHDRGHHPQRLSSVLASDAPGHHLDLALSKLRKRARIFNGLVPLCDGGKCFVSVLSALAAHEIGELVSMRRQKLMEPEHDGCPCLGCARAPFRKGGLRASGGGVDVSG
mmetsp:Transcript_47083/g.106686  ORF Transcript_47083/g.106686 Transcript_47083/m.106686 type:complete len:214 (-) Transcript_47083:170-811(-)